MTSKTDHEVRANVTFCLNLGFIPTQTLQKLREPKHTSCCRSLVFKWHDRYRNGRESFEDDVRTRRPKKISTLIQEICTALLDDDRRFTVREFGNYRCVFKYRAQINCRRIKYVEGECWMGATPFNR